jgi:hypothetical protein
MKVITVATENCGYFETLKQSALQHNYELIVLGYGQKWKGFGWRLKLILNYVKTLPFDEIILVVDAYDVILLRNSQELLHEFLAKKQKFICGAFRKLNGVFGKVQELEFGKSKKDLPPPYNNLCAGTWITYAGYAVKLYDEYEIDDNDDDQILLNRIYDDYEIFADYNFDLFCSLFPNLITNQINEDDKIVIENYMLKSGVTNTYPFVLHALGNANVDHILDDLGYNKKLSKYNYSLQYKLKKSCYHFFLIIKICFYKILNKLF